MEYRIGMSADFSKTISECDVYNYAGIIGDFNPLHFNEIKAKEFLFGKRIAHGMLTASFLSTVIASEMPGPGTIYMEQNARFVRPVFIDDTITAHVEILELMEKKKCKLKTVVLNQNNEIVVDGYAIDKLPE